MAGETLTPEERELARRERHRVQARERMRKRRLENPEYDATIARRYRERHVERLRNKSRQYSEANREALNAKSRAWRKANPQKIRALDAKRNPNRGAERYAKNKEKMQAKAAQWRKDNPEKSADIDARARHQRRARRLHSSEHFTLEEIKGLRAKAGKKCAMCHKRRRLTIDHIIALAKGGSNSIRNIQFLCKPCNSSKQDKDPIKFAQERGFLL